MTKIQMIERYGEAYYQAHLAKTKVQSLAWYYAHPDRRRTKEKTKEAVAKHYSDPENVARRNARHRLYHVKIRASMTREEKLAENRATWQRKKAKLALDPVAAEQFRLESRKRHAAWTEANREYVNATFRERMKRPEVREYYRTASIANQHKRRMAGPMDRKYVEWIRQQPCVDCQSTEKIQVGHIIPIKHGGGNENSNLIPQCGPCNRKLSARYHRLAQVSKETQDA